MTTTIEPSTAEPIRAIVAPKSSNNLASALLKARRAIHATVHKADRNTAPGQGYNYVSHEQVIVAARNVLLEHALLLEQRDVRYAGELIHPAKQGDRPVWRWVGLFALVHGDSGEERTYQFEGTTMPGDKAAFIASTSLDRQAHMRILELAGSDEENAEHQSHNLREADEPGMNARGRAAPRTNDPPGNVHRLGERAEHPELQGALQMFRPKLERITNASGLRDWWQAVEGHNFSRPVMEALWRLFAGHAKRLGQDPRAIAFGGGK